MVEKDIMKEDRAINQDAVLIFRDLDLFEIMEMGTVPYGVNHSGETVAALGNNIDDLSTMLAHVSIKGSLAHVERSVEVQVDDGGKSFGAQHASRRHELSTSIVLPKSCNNKRTER